MIDLGMAQKNVKQAKQAQYYIILQGVAIYNMEQLRYYFNEEILEYFQDRRLHYWFESRNMLREVDGLLQLDKEKLLYFNAVKTLIRIGQVCGVGLDEDRARYMLVTSKHEQHIAQLEELKEIEEKNKHRYMTLNLPNYNNLIILTIFVQTNQFIQQYQPLGECYFDKKYWTFYSPYAGLIKNAFLNYFTLPRYRKSLQMIDVEPKLIPVVKLEMPYGQKAPCEEANVLLHQIL